MARPVTLTTSDASGGAQTSSVFFANIHALPFAVSVAVDVTGTVDFDIQHTLDDPDSGSALWFPHATIDGDTADVDGNYAFPVRGIRLVQNSGSGSCRAVIIQAG